MDYWFSAGTRTSWQKQTFLVSRTGVHCHSSVSQVSQGLEKIDLRMLTTAVEIVDVSFITSG